MGEAVGLVPEFRSAERDRLSVGADGAVRLGRVRLGASAEWLRDTTVAGPAVQGFGDVRLGTALHLGDAGPVGFALGWSVKLPDASDEGELGTDETDILFGGTVGLVVGEVHVVGAVGLAVLGNPLRFANQDDVPMVRLDAAWSHGPWSFGPSARWDVQTERNPHRAEAALRVRYGSRWFVAVEGSAGLTPAAADGGARLLLGWHGDLPVAPVRE